MTPPFTLTGWILGRIADRTELLHVYLQKLKHAKSAEDRMLAHAEFVKGQMERYGVVVKEASEALSTTNALLGTVIQLFRNKQHYDEMVHRNSELDKPAANSLEERLIAIERKLADKRRKLPPSAH